MCWTPPEMIYNAAIAGFDYVSLRTINRGAPVELVHDIARDMELFRLTEQAVKDTGVKIIDTELVKINDSVKDIKEFEPDLDAAARLGIKNVTTNIWTPDKAFYTEKFAELCDLAAEYEMNVNLEFVTWSDVKDLKESLALISETGRKNARVLFDLLHTYRSGVTLDEIRNCPRELIAPAIHACDAPDGVVTAKDELVHTASQARLYLGEGGMYVADAIRALPEETVIGLEIPNTERVKKLGAMEHVRRCLATAKDFIRANGLE